MLRKHHLVKLFIQRERSVFAVLCPLKENQSIKQVYLPSSGFQPEPSGFFKVSKKSLQGSPRFSSRGFYTRRECTPEPRYQSRTQRRTPNGRHNMQCSCCLRNWKSGNSLARHVSQQHRRQDAYRPINATVRDKAGRLISVTRRYSDGRLITRTLFPRDTIHSNRSTSTARAN